MRTGKLYLKTLKEGKTVEVWEVYDNERLDINPETALAKLSKEE